MRERGKGTDESGKEESEGRGTCGDYNAVVLIQGTMRGTLRGHGVTFPLFLTGYLKFHRSSPSMLLAKDTMQIKAQLLTLYLHRGRLEVTRAEMDGGGSLTC